MSWVLYIILGNTMPSLQQVNRYADETVCKQAVKELLNLVTFGLNSNRYLNGSLGRQKIIGQKLDSAIVKEYGANFD